MVVESVTGFNYGASATTGGGCYLQRSIVDLVEVG